MTAPRGTHPDAVDVIFTFSVESWFDAVARRHARPPDQLVAILRRDPRVRGLLVANPFRSLPVHVLRTLARRPRRAAFPSDGGRSALVTPWRLRRQDPTAVASLARSYERYDRAVHRAAGRLGLRDPVVVVVHPLAAGFSPFRWARAVTYYAVDDWAAFPIWEPWHAAFHESYRRIREQERRVAAVSEPLLRRLAPTGPSLVVPNGIDPDEWRDPDPPPPWWADLPRPRLLYTGTLDHRLDTEALAAVAERFPQGTVALVGPLDEPAHLAGVRALPNVVVAPNQDREALVALTSSADVCMIPHVRSSLTEAMSPLKLYEYLAAGRPVATPPLAPVTAAGGRLAIASSGRDFADAVEEALALGPASASEREEFLSANSWAARFAPLVDLVLA